MPSRYLAFDIETAKDFPGEVSNWRRHRPLGISCAATLPSDSDKPTLWYGKTSDGKPAKQMSRQDAQTLAEHLCDMALKGYRILTWNGLAFDFDVLAEESAAAAMCKGCVLDHVDMMFHLFCCLGYPVGLEKAAQGMGLPGKTHGMTGAEAPGCGRKGITRKFWIMSPRTCTPPCRSPWPATNVASLPGSRRKANGKHCPWRKDG